MPSWKDFTGSKEPTPPATPPARDPHVAPVRAEVPPTRAAVRDAGESVLGADLVIEGSIQGSGHIRIAGRFKGDITVQGNVTIESGATVTGTVRGGTVTIAGQLDGNVEGAAKVELLASGVLNGDLTAGSLTVAAGSRMRGQVEFGWEGRNGGTARPAGGGAA